MAHKHTTWGRTRSPKGLYEGIPDDYASIKRSASKVPIVNSVGTLSANLTSATLGQNGYATENQRYLHVIIKGTGNTTTENADAADYNTKAQSIKVYVYSYYSQVWAPLMVHGGDGNWYQATVTTANSETIAEQHQVWTFEIAGIDRVAFVGDATKDPEIYAACSTF